MAFHKSFDSALDAGEREYQDWLKKVDRIMGIKVGLSYNDLADQNWRDWFDDDMSPEEAVEEALENEGYQV